MTQSWSTRGFCTHRVCLVPLPCASLTAVQPRKIIRTTPEIRASGAGSSGIRRRRIPSPSTSCAGSATDNLCRGCLVAGCVGGDTNGGKRNWREVDGGPGRRREDLRGQGTTKAGGGEPTGLGQAALPLIGVAVKQRCRRSALSPIGAPAVTETTVPIRPLRADAARTAGCRRYGSNRLHPGCRCGPLRRSRRWCRLPSQPRP